MTHWRDSSAVEVGRLRHNGRQLGPLKGAEVELPKVSHDQLTIVAAAYKHLWKGEQQFGVKK